jgi:hypothetical protein
MIEETRDDNLLPFWVKENLSTFINQKQDHIILDAILDDYSFKNWSLLGNKLFETVIQKNEYAWLLIDGAYSSLKLLKWVSALSKEAENEDSSEKFFFKYSTFVQPNFIVNDQIEKSAEWLSFSRTKQYPLENNLFSEIAPYDSIGCDIFVASPQVSIDLKDERVFTNTNLISIFKQVGSWIYPIEDHLGFIIGLMEGQPMYNQIKQVGWFNEVLKSDD